MGWDAQSSTLASGRLRTAADKFQWGLRATGPIAALRGIAKFISIWLKRPDRHEVQLRSGPILEFDYPSQFPATLMMFGDFIDPEYPFLQQIGQPGWRVVDIGAAIGQFSMFASMCLPGARIDAFEPSSANVATLQRNIVRNGAEGRVNVYQAALSNRRGTARFTTAPKTWMSQLGAGDDGNADSEVVAVQTLDAVMQLDHVNVLKVNVAGFEPAVLEGAMQTLQRGQVDIMILLLGLSSLPHYAAIAQLGYRFFYYHPGQRTVFEIDKFDADSVLGRRPWPARHILAIRSAAVDDLLAGRITISAAGAGGVVGGGLATLRRWAKG